MGNYRLGTLESTPARDRLDLVAPQTAALLTGLGLLDVVGVVAIDPDISDTAATKEAFGLDDATLANCVVVGGVRAGDERVAAVMVLASTRADVNGVIRKTLDVRKASFLPMDDAVGRTGMEYGGIGPVGLPEGWPILVDAAVASAELVIVGSGVRSSKLLLPGSVIAALPGARVIDGLARPIPPVAE